ncbi:MAG TPA: VTT domain-containing protein [Thiobacillus sp.]|nr:VTT domain-containing protein [Thiobacillus sp.]
MDIANFSGLIAWIARHPEWAYATVFLAAFTESLAVVGLFVPGALIMFGAGAVVAVGPLDLWATLACAAAGAIAGDASSYWLGRHYRAELRNRWPFSRYPKLLEKGTVFFHRHSGMSIFLGRFVGPIRPVIPAVAGMLGMTPARFYAANILSALGWAPTYILPGVVFGASLGLAGAVATRLALTLVLLSILAWSSIWIVSRSVIWLQPRVEHGLGQLQAWAGRALPTRTWSLRGMVASLLDPARPESRALLVFAAVLIAAAWMFFGIIEDVLTGDPLVVVDRTVYHLFQGLRTPFGDSVMIVLTELGDAAVTLPVITAVLLWLAWKRAWRPAAYWLAAASFGAMLTVIFKVGFGLPRPLPLYDGSIAFGFPSSHAAMSIVIFGFLAVLSARELSLRGQLVVFSVMALLAGLIAFSRIYLGAHWLSDVLGGLSFGVAWVALLGIAYLRRPAPAVSAHGLLAVAAIALIVGAGVHATTQRDADIARYAVHRPSTLIAQQDWWNQSWQTLPAWRIDIEGEYEQPLTVQWAGSIEFLRTRLMAQGWREAVPLTGKSLLLWLDTHRPAMQLPLLPHVHDGRHETLALIYPVKGKPDQRLVLRLWPTEKMLQAPRTPIWVGTVAEESISRPLAWFNLPHDGQDFNAPRRVLLESLAGLQARLVDRKSVPAAASEETVWDKGVLLIYQPE